MLKASPYNKLKMAPCTMPKLAPRIMLGVISYHKVLVEDGFAISTDKY